MGATLGSTATVATSLVALHITAYTEGLATAWTRATEWLFTGVAVRVNAEAGRSGEGLIAGAADIPVMVEWVGCSV